MNSGVGVRKSGLWRIVLVTMENCSCQKRFEGNLSASQLYVVSKQGHKIIVCRIEFWMWVSCGAGILTEFLLFGKCTYLSWFKHNFTIFVEVLIQIGFEPEELDPGETWFTMGELISVFRMDRRAVHGVTWSSAPRLLWVTQVEERGCM